MPYQENYSLDFVCYIIQVFWYISSQKTIQTKLISLGPHKIVCYIRYFVIKLDLFILSFHCTCNVQCGLVVWGFVTGKRKLMSCDINHTSRAWTLPFVTNVQNTERETQLQNSIGSLFFIKDFYSSKSYMYKSSFIYTWHTVTQNMCYTLQDQWYLVHKLFYIP